MSAIDANRETTPPIAPKTIPMGIGFFFGTSVTGTISASAVVTGIPPVSTDVVISPIGIEVVIIGIGDEVFTAFISA